MITYCSGTKIVMRDLGKAHDDCRWAVLLAQPKNNIVVAWHSSRESARKQVRDLKKKLGAILEN